MGPIRRGGSIQDEGEDAMLAQAFGAATQQLAAPDWASIAARGHAAGGGEDAPTGGEPPPTLPVGPPVAAEASNGPRLVAVAPAGGANHRRASSEQSRRCCRRCGGSRPISMAALASAPSAVAPHRNVRRHFHRHFRRHFRRHSLRRRRRPLSRCRCSRARCSPLSPFSRPSLRTGAQHSTPWHNSSRRGVSI